MKSTEIQSLWRRHMAELDKSHQAPSDGIAVLFGSDQYELAKDLKSIKLPGFGSVPCDGPKRAADLEWVKVFQVEGEWTMVVGEGNPFEITDGTLPLVNGVVHAAPYMDQNP